MFTLRQASVKMAVLLHKQAKVPFIVIIAVHITSILAILKLVISILLGPKHRQNQGITVLFFDGQFEGLIKKFTFDTIINRKLSISFAANKIGSSVTR